ncbi:MAG: hypothetical protein EA381_20895 [Planctomycetaceae bacterium]|nr:MAG: hypothetical protein EA381_20895 [Planctomycetaceae bacterium]
MFVESFRRASGITLTLCVVGFATTCIAEPLLQLPPVGNPVSGTLMTEQTEPLRLVLTAGPQRSVAMHPLRPSRGQFWTLSPVGPETFRVQLFEAGILWSLSVDPNTGQVGFRRSAQSHEQLWRVTPARSRPGAIRLESYAYPGNFLAGDANSMVSLQSWSRSPSQLWYFDTAPPPPSIAIPLQQLVQHSIRPNPPIPPVVARFVNSNRNELLVRIGDLRTGATKDVTIPAGGRHDVEIERDAGATFTERYDVIGPTGVLLSQEFTTRVPPTIRYDVSVYEKFLQSIAIDRTGKSPNPIEDINYQPKSVGYFVIPPGDQFAGGNIDVFGEATRANNAGAVRRIDPNAFNQPAERTDPLEDVLRGIQSKP